MDCHLAGRKYYDADLVWDYLRVGQTLRLERDMQNPHDPNAIQVIFNKDNENYLLGFIPRSDNKQLAAFLEMGWTDIFDCRINSITPDAASTASPPTPIPKTRCTSPSASAATGAQASCLSNPEALAFIPSTGKAISHETNVHTLIKGRPRRSLRVNWIDYYRYRVFLSLD